MINMENVVAVHNDSVAANVKVFRETLSLHDLAKGRMCVEGTKHHMQAGAHYDSVYSEQASLRLRP